MRTITLKTDDTFFDALGSMAKETGNTKSELIRKAVAYYGELLERDKLKKQILEASMTTRKDSLAVSHEFDEILEDGLNNV